MAINTSPSFMSRLGSAAPGMMNAFAQNFGDPSMAEGVRGASSLLNRSPRRQNVKAGRMGQIPRPMATDRLPIPTSMPSGPMGGGIDTSPRGMGGGGIGMTPPAFDVMGGANNPVLFGGTGGMGMGGFGTGNTGISGGIFNRPPGYERPGLWNTYNQVSGMRPSY